MLSRADYERLVSLVEKSRAVVDAAFFTRQFYGVDGIPGWPLFVNGKLLISMRCEDDAEGAIAKLQPHAEDHVYLGGNGEIGILCVVPEAYADFAAEASRWSDARDFSKLSFERDTYRPGDRMKYLEVLIAFCSK